MSISGIFRKVRRIVPFPVRVEYFRFKRSIFNRFNSKDYTRIKAHGKTGFKHLVFKHKSKLVRDYPEPWYSLQQNKIINLDIIVKKLDMALLYPGKKFSFWTIAGRTSRAKGFKDGMTMIEGKLTKSYGGGLCQLSNALYWSSLNCGFEIIERHRHSYDIFPDTARTLPFGSGATIFFNYMDLVFKNKSNISYLFNIYLDDEFLNIKIFADSVPEIKHKIVEENHSFVKEGGKNYRKNEIYRLHINKKGDVIEKELICKNRALLLYDLDAGNADS